MSRMFIEQIRVQALVATVLFLSCAYAQEKRVPDSRRTEVSADSTSSDHRASLPKIDVSDFVITGASSIEIPVAEKQSLEKPSLSPAKPSVLGERMRATPELSVRARDIIYESKKPLSGKLIVNGGTFLSTDAALWLGRSEPQGRYGVNVDYERSSGFATNADYSGGSVETSGGTLLPSDLSLLDGADLSGRVFFGGTSYGFYGSVQPTLKRTNNFLELSAVLNQVQKFPFVGEIQFRSFTTVDSTETVERTIAFSFAKVLRIQDQPLSFRSELTLTDMSGGQSSSIPIFQSSLHSQAYEFDPVMITAGVSLYVGKNPAGQSFVKLYPELQTAVQLNETHRFVAAYAPRVQRASLEQNLQENPYRQASSEIRHRDISSSGRFAFESFWTRSLSSRVSVNVQSINDFPLLVDSSASGFWQNLYTGTVTRTTIRAEMFAKFKSFDYFASSITLDLSKNSSTGEKLPYLPAFEFVAEYVKVIGDRWKLRASLTIRGVQETQLTPGMQLAGFSQLNLSSSYEVNSFLSAQMSIRNLTNQRGERWRGYQEFPFVLCGGVSVNW